jgi:hypothetical protein
MSLRDFFGITCVACGKRRIVGILSCRDAGTREVTHAGGRVCVYKIPLSRGQRRRDENAARN